jgi:hypothetical protein
MGGLATVGKRIKVKIKAHLPEKDKRTATLRLIREGVVIKEISLKSSIDMEMSDEYFKPGGKTYYRVDINDRLVSNPIFVKMENN